MKKNVPVLVFVAAVAAAFFLTECHSDVSPNDKDNPLVGKTCTVQFRSDVLGMTTSTPASPSSTIINGVDTTVKGLLRSTQGDWVVVESNGQEVWIPKEVILAIRF